MNARFKGIFLYAAERGNDTRMSRGNGCNAIRYNTADTDQKTNRRNDKRDHFLFWIHPVLTLFRRVNERTDRNDQGDNAKQKQFHMKLLLCRISAVSILLCRKRFRHGIQIYYNFFG